MSAARDGRNARLSAMWPTARPISEATAQRWLRFEMPYQERLARIGAELGRRLHEHGMHWWDKQLAEYQALPVWKDFPGEWEAALVAMGLVLSYLKFLPPVVLVVRVIEVIQMQQKSDWVGKYFTPEQQAKGRLRGRQPFPLGKLHQLGLANLKLAFQKFYRLLRVVLEDVRDAHERRLVLHDHAGIWRNADLAIRERIKRVDRRGDASLGQCQQTACP